MAKEYGQMRQMSKKIRTFLLGLVICACRVQSVGHDPVKAASDTKDFLRALYVDTQYEKALSFADPQLRQSLTAEDLKHLAEDIQQQRGDLRTLKADSYLMTPGATMELFYIGTYERGNLYHRLVLRGDALSGYRVSGVWYSTDPYPDQSLRRKFSERLVVK